MSQTKRFIGGSCPIGGL